MGLIGLCPEAAAAGVESTLSNIQDKLVQQSYSGSNSGTRFAGFPLSWDRRQQNQSYSGNFWSLRWIWAQSIVSLIRSLVN